MRYALFFAPPPASPLWQTGSRWLGWDAVSGVSQPQPRISGVDPDELAELTRASGICGFHAKFVPPFRLARGIGEDELCARLADFAARQRPISLSPLEIVRRDRAFCLCPTRHSADLHMLAALCVRAFDRCRTPPTPTEMARCRAAMLNGQEKRNLEMWGYPYVFDQFHFQFPLTARITAAPQDELIHRALLELFTPLLTTPLLIDAICLFVEPATGQRMRCLRRFPFPSSSSTPEECLSHAPQILQKDVHPGYQCHSSRFILHQ